MQNLFYSAAIIALLFVATATYFLLLMPTQTLGSTISGQEYQATTTISTSAGTHWQARVAANGGCSLGSVVVASSSNTVLRIWNATSTTDIASTTIVTFDSDVLEGTYTFDISCSRGLVVDTPASFDGVYTVTFR